MTVIKRVNRSIVLGLILAFSMVDASASSLQSAVKVSGLSHLEARTFWHYFGPRPKQLSQLRQQDYWSKKIVNLYRSGFFSDVAVYRTSDVWTVVVHERPVIKSLHLQPFKNIDEAAFKGLIKQYDLKKSAFYSKARVHQFCQKVQALYKKKSYFNAHCDVAVKRVSGHGVALTVMARETKDQVIIDQIKIEGNQIFSDYQLKRVMPISATSFWTFFSNKNIYTEQGWNAALEQLKHYYQSHGYFDFRVIDQQVRWIDHHQKVILSAKIHEGRVYQIHAASVHAEKHFDPTLLAKMQPIVKILEGMAYTEEMADFVKQRLNKVLTADAMNNFQVILQKVFNRKAHEVMLRYNIQPDYPFYVRHINFYGNDTISDRVLRREMRQYEGSLISRDALQSSTRHLNNLGFVEHIKMAPVLVSAANNLYDIDVHLKEKSVISANFQVGYGSGGDGLIYALSFKNANFLGVGESIDLGFNHTKTRQRYRLAIDDPYNEYDGRSRGYGVYMSKSTPGDYIYSQYVKDSYGGYLNYGIPLSDYWHFNYGYGFSFNHMKHYDASSTEVKGFIVRHGNDYQDFKITFGVGYSSLDRAIFASRGQMLDLSAALRLPVMDKSTKYYTVHGEWGFFYPLTQFDRPKSNFILGLNTQFDYGRGYGSYRNDFPIYANYFGGGIGSVKAYESGSLGPKDSLGKMLGGNVSYMAQAQVMLPGRWFAEGMQVSAFVDAGQVAKNQLLLDQIRASYGVMVKWYTPLAPLTFSYAWPLRNKPGDSIHHFQFMLGAEF